MNDAARAKAIEFARSFDPRSPQSRIEMLSQLLDAYETEQTVALRAEVERLRAALEKMRGYACDESARHWPDDPQFDADCAEADALLAAPEGHAVNPQPERSDP